MPIMAAQPILQTQLTSILSKGIAANPDAFALEFTSALASVVPMGLFFTPFPVPLVPTGFSACQNLIKQSLSLGMAANLQTTSLMMATGISLLAPLAPPVGLLVLQTQIKNAISMDMAANKLMVASILSIAIPQYYMSGGVL